MVVRNLDTTFRNVGIVGGRLDSEAVRETVEQLIRYLQVNNRHVVLEQETAVGLKQHVVQSCHLRQLGDAADLVVALIKKVSPLPPGIK